jgi:serine/threonine protein kinase
VTARETNTRSDALVGVTVGGRYRLVRRLGSGAFADVYLAQHTSITSMNVAVKVLKSASLSNPTTKQRFQQEAWVAGAVRSPWVVQVYDADVTDQMDLAWIAMEYVEGPTLHHVMRSLGPLPDRLVAPWLAGVLRGLVAIHSAGIVHRDLKPGNVLLAWPPSDAIPLPRVVDFGIAKVVDAVTAPETGDDLTNTGATVCTPRYVAPEQLLRNPVAASDLYSLGIIGMMMLAGQAPYTESDGAVLMARHLSPDPVPVHPLVAASPLAAVLRRAVEKQVERRHASALEMLDAIEPIARQQASNPIPPELVSALEALFPADTRSHWALRRQAANSATLPSGTKSPLFDPVAAARANGAATGPLPAVVDEPVSASVSEPNRLARLAVPTVAHEASAPGAEHGSPAASPRAEGRKAGPPPPVLAQDAGTDELSAASLVVLPNAEAELGPDPTTPRPFESGRDAVSADTSVRRVKAHRNRRWGLAALAAFAAVGLLLGLALTQRQSGHGPTSPSGTEVTAPEAPTAVLPSTLAPRPQLEPTSTEARDDARSSAAHVLRVSETHITITQAGVAASHSAEAARAVASEEAERGLVRSAANDRPPRATRPRRSQAAASSAPPIDLALEQQQPQQPAQQQPPVEPAGPPREPPPTDTFRLPGGGLSRP